MAFLSQLLRQVRTAVNSPLTILVNPVAVMIELCLDDNCTEEEVVCATTQVWNPYSHCIFNRAAA